MLPRGEGRREGGRRGRDVEREENSGQERKEGEREGGREGGQHTSRGHKAVLAITSAIILAKTQVTEMEELGKAFLTTVLRMAYRPYFNEPWME